MSDAQLIDELCEVCVQLAGIVKRQSEMLAQDRAVETALAQAERICNVKE